MDFGIHLTFDSIGIVTEKIEPKGERRPTFRSRLWTASASSPVAVVGSSLPENGTLL